jgi:hypothetical protein
MGVESFIPFSDDGKCELIKHLAAHRFAGVRRVAGIVLLAHKFHQALAYRPVFAPRQRPRLAKSESAQSAELARKCDFAAVGGGQEL